MESNGARGRIQVSQSTADLLVADGKGHWLTQREDLVRAKGKGLMQTYWCTISNSSGSSLTNSDSFVFDRNFVTGDGDGSNCELEMDAAEESINLDDRYQKLD